MSRLQLAIAAAAFIAVAGTASANGYHNGPKDYGYVPAPEVIEEADEGKVVYSYTEVKIRYRGAPAYGYGRAYFNGPPELWRQREVAYDAIFTQEKRIVYDSNRAAQTRAALKFYGPEPSYAPPSAGLVGPIIDPAGSCGTFRYWNGAGCVDARFHSRYENPYKRRYLHK